MDEKKICFISCVNDEVCYQECLWYIRQLQLPKGYSVDCIPVYGAKSITQGYNEAMNQSDAKYKVYLHQDVFIVYAKILLRLLALFKENPKIGLVGVAGTKTMPASGYWWEGRAFGAIYDSHSAAMEKDVFEQPVHWYEDVEAIDGVFMMTQYDLAWQEREFDGWHFYDISQSFEFLRRGYKVIVPRQKEPWLVHDCGALYLKEIAGQTEYDRYRRRFIQKYFQGNSSAEVSKPSY